LRYKNIRFIILLKFTGCISPLKWRRFSSSYFQKYRTCRWKIFCN